MADEDVDLVLTEGEEAMNKSLNSLLHELFVGRLASRAEVLFESDVQMSPELEG